MFVGYQKECRTELWITYRPVLLKATKKLKLVPTIYSSDTKGYVVGKAYLDLERLLPGLNKYTWFVYAQEAFEERYAE
jgi:hypothetical protein